MNDDQKIVWKKSSDSNKKNTTKSDNGIKTHDPLDDKTILDLAKRSSDYKKSDTTDTKTINNLQNDIKNLLNDINTEEKATPVQKNISLGLDSSPDKDIKTESVAGSAIAAVAMAAIDKKQQTERPDKKEKKDATSVESIQKSIQADFEKIPNEINKDNVLDDQTKKLLSEKEQKKGIEQTYYSDLSQAMGSNEPATMSELLRKARFEKKAKEIFSPRSKKNILYILGALILIGGIIALFSTIFKPEKKVKYITEKKVASLVYSDRDTGINTTGIESAKIKQAVRKVVETDIPENTIHQIYYAGKDSLENVRRLGVKQMFEATENVPPKLLYENIENDFMHGVYKTDKNHPFIILKALSYDRAFEGMREWEPTMIDDLSTYFDLPKEAGDRSLLEPGFDDDLIKNKNIRVARFLPREVDKRGILNIFGKPSAIVEDNANPLDNTVSYLQKKIQEFVTGSTKNAYAQIIFQQQGGGTSNIGGGAIGGGGAIDTIPKNRQACFELSTGERLSNPKSVEIYEKVCFDSYQCAAYECFTETGQPTNVQNEGNPGVQCRETKFLKSEEVDTYSGRKICHAYPEILNLQNLKNKRICFDAQGNYREGYDRDADGNLPTGFNCIEPINRDASMCIDQSNKVVFKDPSIPESSYKVCFGALENTTSFVDEQFYSINQDIRQQVAAIAIDLRIIASTIHVFSFLGANISIEGNTIDDLVSKLNEASNFFIEFSTGNILENDFINKSLAFVRQFETSLNIVNPQGIYDNELPFLKKLRDLINLIKDVSGFSHNVGWGTLGNEFPNGIPVPVGGIVQAGETVLEVVEPAQQVLVLMGLMDSVSVTGQLDLVTQDAISTFQALNGITQTGVIDTATINILNNIIANAGSLYGGVESVSINDYIETSMGFGAYNEDVQILQILLYAEGYNIDDIDGLFDAQVCEALVAYQTDNGLNPADNVNCFLSGETIKSLNDFIRTNGYLGTGFALNANGFLQGHGLLEGRLGPGAVDFSTKVANADHLKEGDIVLMYTFLDEKTILITRHESVITEIIKRRAFDDIFNKQ